MRDQSITENPRIAPLDMDRTPSWWRRNLAWLIRPRRRDRQRTPSWWRRNLAWLIPGAGLVVILAILAVVFSFWRTDQVAVRPGSVEEVPSRITISGAEVFPPKARWHW